MAEIARLNGHREWIDLDLWSASGPPSQRWRWVFNRTLRGSRCRIPSTYSIVWVSNAVGLHVRLFATTTTALTELFLRELRQKHDVETAVFLVDCAQHLQTALQRAGLRFQMCRHGNRNAVERIFRELKRRTSSFSNCFSHAEPVTAEKLLQSFARWYNALN